MKKRLNSLISLTLIFMLILPLSVQAMPANSAPFLHTGKDGNTLTVRMVGDEFFHYFTDADNNLLVRDEEGDFHHVYLEGEKIRTAFGEKEREGIFYAKASVLSDTEMKKQYAALAGSVYDPSVKRILPDPVTPESLVSLADDCDYKIDDPGSGALPLVTIVVGLNDLPYEESYAWSEKIYGEDGSLQNYYSRFSGGRFTFVPAHETYEEKNGTKGFDEKDDGIIHVKLDIPHGKWGDRSDGGLFPGFKEAVNSAIDKAAEFIDFNSYDKNGNGMIDNTELGVSFIVAGYEAAEYYSQKYEGVSENQLTWSHQSYLFHSPGNDPDAVKINSYIAVSEKLRPGHQEPLGALYHELGHYLGLPDLYDTEYLMYEQPEKAVWAGFEPAYLSIMDEGSWAYVGDHEYIPIGFDAWCRYYLGWVKAEEADKDGIYRLFSQESEEGYNLVRIDTDQKDEYFLLENRRSEGLEAALSMYQNYTVKGVPPSCNGIVIWHIDDNVNKRYWDEKAINNADHRPAVSPVYPEASYNAEEGGYSTFSLSLNKTRPIKGLPFYSRSNFELVFKDCDGYEDGLFLPLYGKGEYADDPDKRHLSSINLRFIEDDSRAMAVEISGIPEKKKEAEENEETGRPLTEVMKSSDLAILEGEASSQSKNAVLKKADNAIEERVREKKTVSLNATVKGKEGNKEYWVLISLNKALRYDGRSHILNNAKKKSTSKNPDIDVKVYYCEKSGRYAVSSPSANDMAGGWTEAPVKKTVIRNGKNAAFDYAGKKLESIKGLSKVPCISSITLSDKKLNKTLGKAINKELKALTKKLRSDKKSSCTDADTELSSSSTELQLIIPIYPLFIGTEEEGRYTDANLNTNSYRFTEGSFDSAKKKLKGTKVSFTYHDGRKKNIKLKYSPKKDKDFSRTVKDAQLSATGNFFGVVEI
ncbi:MAG: M6 family metalloprotease domain-containing protein [Lachnospiraceae bacterium]|nr:M6 family metalloprotease domain-containing protein [Lachnospiraceae bacterium]